MTMNVSVVQAQCQCLQDHDVRLQDHDVRLQIHDKRFQNQDQRITTCASDIIDLERIVYGANEREMEVKLSGLKDRLYVLQLQSDEYGHICFKRRSGQIVVGMGGAALGTAGGFVAGAAVAAGLAEATGVVVTAVAVAAGGPVVPLVLLTVLTFSAGGAVFGFRKTSKLTAHLVDPKRRELDQMQEARLREMTRVAIEIRTISQHLNKKNEERKVLLTA
ncbi:MAG: hypothetical protein HW387_680 [Parachlamydiales bacterium]|nr:hypothetical protein [Parachlamydiales bacterium]